MQLSEIGPYKGCAGFMRALPYNWESSLGSAQIVASGSATEDAFERTGSNGGSVDGGYTGL